MALRRHVPDAPLAPAAGRQADRRPGGRAAGTAGVVIGGEVLRMARRRRAASEVAAPEGLIDTAGKATRDTVAVAVEGYEEAPRHETILFNMLTGFVGAFALMRLSTWGQKGGWWPVDPVKVQGPPHPPLRPGHPDRVRRRRHRPRDQQRASRGGALVRLRRRGRPHLRRGGAAARPARRLLDPRGRRLAPAQLRPQPRCSGRRCSPCASCAAARRRASQQGIIPGMEADTQRAGGRRARCGRRSGGRRKPLLGFLAHPDDLLAAGPTPTSTTGTPVWSASAFR